MLDFRITKKEKLYEQNNDMAHNYYYLIHGRIYNEDKTKYRRFRYVEWFDIFDVQEFYEKDYITKEDIKNYVDELSVSTIESYISNLKEFYKFCNETIDRYNDLAKHW